MHIPFSGVARFPPSIVPLSSPLPALAQIFEAQGPSPARPPAEQLLSSSLNTLKIIYGSIVRVVKGGTRSLDNSSL